MFECFLKSLGKVPWKIKEDTEMQFVVPPGHDPEECPECEKVRLRMEKEDY